MNFSFAQIPLKYDCGRIKRLRAATISAGGGIQVRAENLFVTRRQG